MKIYLLVLILLTACANQSDPAQQTLSTVDSNVISVGDSTPAILHIDTTAGSDTAFDVAMDSAGRVITARDTSKIKL